MFGVMSRGLLLVVNIAYIVDNVADVVVVAREGGTHVEFLCEANHFDIGVAAFSDGGG